MEGALVEEGASVVGRSYTCQIAMGSVLVDLVAFMRGTPASCFILDQAAIVSGSFIFCTCCILPSILLIYRHIFQTGLPHGGFIQGHVDQKYLYSISCMLECRTTVFLDVKISRCVTFILVYIC